MKSAVPCLYNSIRMW